MCSVLVSFLRLGHNSQGKQLPSHRKRNLFWLLVSEVSTHCFRTSGDNTSKQDMMEERFWKCYDLKLYCRDIITKTKQSCCQTNGADLRSRGKNHQLKSSIYSLTKVSNTYTKGGRGEEPLQHRVPRKLDIHIIKGGSSLASLFTPLLSSTISHSVTFCMKYILQHFIQDVL